MRRKSNKSMASLIVVATITLIILASCLIIATEYKKNNEISTGTYVKELNEHEQNLLKHSINNSIDHGVGHIDFFNGHY